MPIDSLTACKKYTSLYSKMHIILSTDDTSKQTTALAVLATSMKCTGPNKDCDALCYLYQEYEVNDVCTLRHNNYSPWMHTPCPFFRFVTHQNMHADKLQRVTLPALLHSLEKKPNNICACRAGCAVPGATCPISPLHNFQCILCFSFGVPQAAKKCYVFSTRFCSGLPRFSTQAC